jgi:hypothetical protein
MTKDCMTCGGTGRQILNVSHFTADGVRPVCCGICGGTGKSDYHHDSAFVREQKERREAASKPPRSKQPQVDVAEFVRTLT